MISSTFALYAISHIAAKEEIRVPTSLFMSQVDRARLSTSRGRSCK